MIFKKSLSLALLAFMSSFSVYANRLPSPGGFQSEGEKAEKQDLEKRALELLKEVIRETPGLRLIENRIRIQMTAGDLLWKHDEKRARAIFGNLVPELRELIDDKDASEQTIQVGSSLRREVVILVSRRDPKLARDIMRATRLENLDDWPQYVQAAWEGTTDFSMVSEIARTDPGEALEMAKESLKKDYSYGLINLFSNLHSSNPEAAATLLNLIVKKLKSESSSWNPSIAGFAVTLASYIGSLSEHSSKLDKGEPQNKSSKMEIYQSDVRELVNMLVSAVMTASAGRTRQSASSLPLNIFLPLLQIKKLIEEHAPDRARAVLKKLDSVMPPEELDTSANQKYESVRQTGSVDDLLTAASGAPAEMKNMMQVEATMKAIESGDFDRARQIVSESKIDSAQKRQWLEHVNDSSIQRAISAGKMDEARYLLSNFRAPEKRSVLLAQIASHLAADGDKKMASQLFNEAISLVNSRAGNREQLEAQLAVAKSIHKFDPAISFDLLGLAVDRFNEIIPAAALVEGFGYLGLFRNGEVSPTMEGEISQAIFNTTRALSFLTKSDFDRAIKVADGFQREEVRLFARLAVASGVLSDDFASSETPTNGPAKF